MVNRGQRGVDDIFMYNFKKNMLLFLLIAGLGLVITGLSFRSEITDNNKKILANKFFLLKMSETYKEAENINKDNKFGKIDVLTVNELLDLTTILKNDLSKKGKIENFKLNTLDLTRTINKTTSINLTVSLDNKEEVFKLLNYYIDNDILSKKFNITYANGKWLLDATLQFYYRGELSKDLLKKFKEKEVVKKTKYKNK